MDTGLSLKNPHERDARIAFEPVEHKYTIDADPSAAYVSVTTWIHTHFREFDTDGIIQRMMASRNWKQSQYYGMTADAIKAAWDANRDAAAAAGTAMHSAIECHYNGLNIDMEQANSTEFGYFLQFYRDHAAKVRPYRTEWTVFDESVRISGSIDMVFENLGPRSGLTRRHVEHLRLEALQRNQEGAVWPQGLLAHRGHCAHPGHELLALLPAAEHVQGDFGAVLRQARDRPVPGVPAPRQQERVVPVHPGGGPAGRSGDPVCGTRNKCLKRNKCLNKNIYKEDRINELKTR